jgi:hypothetical protein
MSCRRIRRELLWLVRFGDFDAGSAPHLEHLAGCQGCRDEVGLDRALVRQLRTALAERIGDASPSPSAWEGVMARMAQPESTFRRPWSSRLAAFLRAGSAMAGASLALMLALNLELAPIGSIPAPESTDPEVITATTQAGRGAGMRPWEGRTPAAGTGLIREEGSTIVWMPTPAEQLPLARSNPSAPAGEDIVIAPTVDPADAPADGGPAVVINLVPSDAATMSGSNVTDESDEPDDQPAAPAAPPAGGPS